MAHSIRKPDEVYHTSIEKEIERLENKNGNLSRFPSGTSEHKLFRNSNVNEERLATDYRHVPHVVSLFQNPWDACQTIDDFEEKGRPDYEMYLDKARRERRRMGFGNSGAINNLYRFWSYFLQNNFSVEMFNDFRNNALEDLSGGFRYGIECLFRYYSYGLEDKFRPLVFNNFQLDVISDYETGQLYGLEKLWAFLRYYEDAPKLQIMPKLKYHLSKFKTIDDFRLQEKIRGQHYSNRYKQSKGYKRLIATNNIKCLSYFKPSMCGGDNTKSTTDQIKVYQDELLQRIYPNFQAPKHSNSGNSMDSKSTTQINKDL